MRKHNFLLFLIIPLLSAHLFGQTSRETKKYQEIASLQNKRDSFEIAYNYCMLPVLHKQILKLDKKLVKEKQQNMKLLNRVDSILAVAYYTGDSLYEIDQYDLAVPFLSKIITLYDEGIQVKNIDYKKATVDMAMIYAKSDKRKNQDSAVYYFSRSIDFGNQEMEGLINLMACFYPKSKSFYSPLLDKMNRRFLSKTSDSLITDKIVLRLIYLADQLPRVLCYAGNKNYLSIEFVSRTDSLNQIILGYLMDNELLINFKDLGDDIRSISTVLLHAPFSNPIFFEKYFSKYAASHDYDFKNTNSLTFLFDTYLNCTRKKQYFGTVRDVLPNGKFGSPSIENSDTVNQILIKLKIDPKYIQNYYCPINFQYFLPLYPLKGKY